MSDCHDDSFLPLGAAQPPLTELSPSMEQCAMNIYRQAWTAYEDVGCPYGETDKAMLVWYSFQNKSVCPYLLTGKN